MNEWKPVTKKVKKKYKIEDCIIEQYDMLDIWYPIYITNWKNLRWSGSYRYKLKENLGTVINEFKVIELTLNDIANKFDIPIESLRIKNKNYCKHS